MIYTLGYGSTKLPAIADLLTDTGATLVDVRLVPRSISYLYGRSTLQTRFGAQYIHLPEWGNLNYRNAALPFRINDWQRGLYRIAPALTNAVLMCACADGSKCHRSLLAAKLRALGWECVEYGQMTLTA